MRSLDELLPPATVLLADPPWRFGDKLPGTGRGADKHYPCLTTAEIQRFPLPPLAANCLLLLWRVAAMQQDALDVMRTWGFTLKSEVVWNKVTKHDKQHFGMGHYVRACHEVCLIGVRGRVAVADRAVRSAFEAPVQEHSRKPDEIYNIADRLMPKGARFELFARHARPGWIALGNEIAAPVAAKVPR